MATVRFPIPATNRLAALPVEALSHILAHLLTTAVASNDQLETKGTVTRFHSKQPPPLEIGAYLKRLVTFTPFPRDAILLAVVYLNRITHLPYTTEPNVHPTPILSVRPPRLPPRPPASPYSPPAQQHATTDAEPGESPHVDAARLSAPTSPIHAASPLPPSPTISSVDRPRATPILNSYTLHRLLLTSLLIACKFSVDGTLSQTRAAKVGGVTPQELCKLEGEGLRLLGWSLMWSLNEIEGACREVERRGEAAGVIDPEQADRDAATPTMSNSHIELASSHPDAAAESESLPPSPLLAGAAAFTLLPDDDLPTPSSRRNSHSKEHPRPSFSSASSPSSLPSSSSEASPSQPSSRSSSPSFLSFKAAGVAAFRHNLLPDVSESSSSSSRRGRSRRGNRAAEDDQQSTPPSSPSQASSVGGQSDLDEKEGGPACSKRASMETVRRVEGLSLTG